MSKPIRVRKKPIEVEAIEWDGSDEAREWIKKNNGSRELSEYEVDGRKVCRIHTLEGTMDASYGDYIIKGVQGELYPCKPDIFWKTYEEVE
jgi:hypothetical protein